MRDVGAGSTSQSSGPTGKYMFAKIMAVLALVLLPWSVSLWRQSYTSPAMLRFDVTLYKSLNVYLRDGLCGLRLLSMPTKTASRTEFRTPLVYNALPAQASLFLGSTQQGPYRTTWFVFPFWLVTSGLLVFGAVPILRGPVRRTWRRRRGHCTECGYCLTGNPTGRCSECGAHLDPHGRRNSARRIRPGRSTGSR